MDEPNGSPPRIVMKMKDARPSGRSEFDRSHEPPGQERSGSSM